MPTVKEEFLKGFDGDVECIRVFISMPGCPAPEMIENPKCNFPYKRAYYDMAYDDSLHLKANKDIYICGAELVVASANEIHRLEVVQDNQESTDIEQ